MSAAYAAPSAGGRRDVRATAQALLHQVDTVGGIVTRAAVERQRVLLEEPIQVGLAGRVSAGKSTLVNALVGSTVAPTAARELTSFLTVYQYGLPPRAEAHLRDGSTQRVPLTDTGPDVAELVAQEVVYLSVSIPQAALHRFSYVDTPGLGSAATRHGERTEAALLAGEIPHLRPEVLLYVVRDAVREDDLAFVSKFSAAGGGTRSGVTTVAVLCHADNFGAGAWGSVDPVSQAHAYAARIPDQVPTVQAGVAVSGLLAESARTGALREHDVQVLRRLRGVDDTGLQLAAHLGPPAGLSASELERLSAVLGAYGLRHGRDHVDNSVTLRGWMDRQSGLASLESLLHGIVVVRTDCLRVERMFAELTAQARRESWGSALTGMIEAARATAPFHSLDEWRAWESLRAVEPTHELVTVLEQVLSGEPTSSDNAVDPLGHAARYQQLAATSGTAIIAHAARVLSRSMVIRAKEVTR